MKNRAILSDGTAIPIILPSRYYESCTKGMNGERTYGRFSVASMVDFISETGFDGIDVSLESIVSYGDYDDSWRSVYYNLASRAAALGLILPVCHLPFIMPDPDDAIAMKRFSASVRQGIDAAGFMNIKEAVIHPIVRHSSRCGYDEWVRRNMEFLSPLCERAAIKGISLAIENMAGIPYRDGSGNPVKGDIAYGSRAEDVCLLADKLHTGICWDFGHANLTGLCQSAELSVVGDRLSVLHIHDNDGVHDLHLPPLSDGGNVDWDDAAEGLRAIGFTSKKGRCLNFELKTSDLSPDRDVRLAHAAQALSSAMKFARKL